jgi:hypothetical protein
MNSNESKPIVAKLMTLRPTSCNEDNYKKAVLAFSSPVLFPSHIFPSLPSNNNTSFFYFFLYTFPILPSHIPISLTHKFELNHIQTMCGIFAYLNYLTEVDRQTIANILTNGLKRLEYRGYDSAGKNLPLFPFSITATLEYTHLNKNTKERKNTCTNLPARFSHTFRAIENV